MRILVAEDEKSLNRIITKRLIKEGYCVDSCFDGEEAYDYIKSGEFDAIVSDIMMPKCDGVELVKKIRGEGIKTPVIFLTARDSIEDRVIGLDSGAEDYLVKPFAFEELLARIRVLIRKQAGSGTNLLTIGDLRLDISTRQVTRSGKSISLSAKEFDVLEYLMQNKNTVLSREQIENHVWNFDYSGGTNVVDVYIRYLRKKIDDSFETKFIQTIRGVGYMLKEEK